MHYVSQEMFYKFGKWSAGDAVIHNGRSARVVAVGLGAYRSFLIDTVSVPIMYDNEEGGFILVVEGELTNRILS